MMQDNKISGQDVFQRLNDSVFLNNLEYTELNEAIIRTPVQGNVLETAFPVKVSANPFAEFHEYHKLDEYGNATESAFPGDADAIEVNGTKVRVQLPWYHADYKFTVQDLNNVRNLGLPLDASKARAAAQKVNDLFDAALYSRSSVYGTLGAYGLFTGTAVATRVWSAAAPYEIFNDVVNFIKAVPAAYQTPEMRMIVHQDNYHEMSRISDANPQSARNLLAQSYPGLQIIVSKEATEGFGLLYPFRDDVIYLVVGMPLRTVEWDNKPWEGHYKAVRSGRLIVVTATAGIKFGGV